MSYKLIGGEEMYFSTKESVCYFSNSFMCLKLPIIIMPIIHEPRKKF